ncbi:MAG: hypothetical protein ACKO96_22715, partial [Flammeovirgaceae bacterium]
IYLGEPIIKSPILSIPSRERSKYVDKASNLGKKINSTDYRAYNRNPSLRKPFLLKGASRGTLPIADTKDPSLKCSNILEQKEGLACIKVCVET